MAICEQITELTPEQSRALLREIALWRDPAWFTNRAYTKSQVDNAVRRLYVLLGLPEPAIRWAGSPAGNVAAAIQDRRLPRALINAKLTVFVHEQVVPPLVDAVNRRLGADVRARLEVMRQEMVPPLQWCRRNFEQLPSWTRLRVNPDGTGDVWKFKADSWGPLDFYWVAPYDFVRRELDCDIFDAETHELLDTLLTLLQGASAYLFFEQSCYISERPTAYDIDAQGRLAEGNSPAFAFPDGETIFMRGGRAIAVQSHFVRDPQSIGVKTINEERNVTLRRILVELYGAERYLKESRAQKVHQDKYGTLWRLNLRGDEPLQMVEVVNSTPEPDGTYKHYFLRVPPDVRTAREAVAWSFDVDEGAYSPSRET